MQSRSIAAAVGRGPLAKNRPDDVKTVQNLLNLQVRFDGGRPLDVNGRVSQVLIGRIEQFQRNVVKLSRPDGRVDPGGKTIKALNQHQRGAYAASNSLKLSAKGKKLLKEIETGDGNPQLKPYDDQTSAEISSWVKGATIGYGHLISSAEWDTYKDGISKEEAESLFQSDLAPFERVINSSVKASLSQQQFDALIFLVFNIGAANFKSSSALKLINDPTATTSYSSLDAAWKAWNKSQGKVMQGLKNRRAAELDIYHKGVYKRW